MARRDCLGLGLAGVVASRSSSPNIATLSPTRRLAHSLSTRLCAVRPTHVHGGDCIACMDQDLPTLCYVPYDIQELGRIKQDGALNTC